MPPHQRRGAAAVVEVVEPRLLLATTTLSAGDGVTHGALSVTVDAYGAFGVNTAAGDVLYTPPHGQPVGAVFESAVYVAQADRFLSSSGIPGVDDLPEIPFRRVEAFAESEFDAGGFHVFLTQTVASMSFGGRLTQRYAFRNMGTGFRDLRIVRHVNTDVQAATGAARGAAAGDREVAGEVFHGELVVGGLMAHADPALGEPSYHLSAFNVLERGIAGDGYPDETTVAHRAAGPAAGGFAAVVASDGIPADQLDRIAGDADQSGLAEAAYDVALSLQSDFLAVAPGEWVVANVITDFDNFLPAAPAAPAPGAGGRPTASLVPVPTVTDRDATGVTLTVHYEDDVAVDVASLGDDDLLVQFGASHPVEFLGAETSADGRTVVATYWFDFPLEPGPVGYDLVNGQGTYRLWVVPGRVSDVGGRSVAAGALPNGKFDVTIHPPGPDRSPDLLPGPVEWIGAGSAGAFVAGGRAPAARVRVSNAGGSTLAHRVDLVLVASLDPAVAAGNVDLGRFTLKLRLAPGASKVYTVRPNVFPAALPDGDYFTVARLETGPSWQDRDRTNDWSVSPSAVRIAAPFTDLRLGGPLNGPRRSPKAGGTARVSVTVRNDGNVASTQPVAATLLLSSDRVAGGDDRVIGPSSIPARLKPGSARTARFRFTLPPDLAPGRYFLVLVLDDQIAIGDASVIVDA